jgi:hypothetical protein
MSEFTGTGQSGVAAVFERYYLLPGEEQAADSHALMPE